MDESRWLEMIREDSDRLATAARGNLDKGVPSCPEWTMQDLVLHTAAAHSWVQGMVESRATTSGDAKEFTEGDPIEWFLDGSRALVDTLQATDSDTPVWTWFRPNRTAGFWKRRMAQETSVHRWDGENAAGEARPFDPDVAVDGIDEWLRVVVTARGGDDGWLKGSVHIHATDADGEWLVEPADGSFTVNDGHAKGDAVLRGPASDLQLVLMQRKDPSAVEILGDEAVATTLITRMTF